MRGSKKCLETIVGAKPILYRCRDNTSVRTEHSTQIPTCVPVSASLRVGIDTLPVIMEDKLETNIKCGVRRQFHVSIHLLKAFHSQILYRPFLPFDFSRNPANRQSKIPYASPAYRHSNRHAAPHFLSPYMHFIIPFTYFPQIPVLLNPPCKQHRDSQSPVH